MSERLDVSNVSVKDLHKSDKTWYWTVIVKDGCIDTRKGDFRDQVIECNTNELGNGLWQNGKQTDGTCQFSLSGASKSTAYGRIRRRFGEYVPA